MFTLLLTLISLAILLWWWRGKTSYHQGYQAGRDTGYRRGKKKSARELEELLNRDMGQSRSA